jgi:hypothetical protein
LELGPFFWPNPATTLTNLLLYWMRHFARPVFFSGFNLRGLAADLTGKSEGTVNLASYRQDVDIVSEVFENCNAVKR